MAELNFDMLIRPFARLGGCRLCWRVTLAVFAAIFAVEVAILVPSYQNHERDLLDRLNDIGQTAVASALILHSSGDGVDLPELGARLARYSKLVGFAIYHPGRERPHIYGEPPDMTFNDAGPGFAERGYADGGRRYEAVWLPWRTGLPFTVVGRMDSSQVAGQLRSFLWRIGALVLLITGFVCAVTMYVLGRTVLFPLLTIRDNLVMAVQDPASADRFVLPERRRDELGEVTVKLNEMLRMISRTYREELATMLSMVDRSAEGMLVYDASGRIVYANQATLALCGFDDVRAMQAAGAPGFRAMGETRSRHLIDLLDKGPYTGEVTITGQGDIAVPCLISGSRLEDDDGAPSRYFATIADISQLREMYDSLESQNAELAASNRAKAQFLANMSHELRTPLNAIIGFSEIMRSELGGAADNSQYKEFSNHIHESGSHLLQLINDILDLSKIDAGKLELEDEIVDVRAAIDSSVRQVQGRADAHSISLDTDIDAGLAPLRADDRKLKQVLINLMSNAIKFTPDGGAVMVTARAEPDGGLAIAVSDNGVGISEHDLSRVFSPFVQVNADLDRRYEGTGLGLPLTKAIVELHGGTVTLESRPGVGTTATVRLPAERVVASHQTGAAAAG